MYRNNRDLKRGGRNRRYWIRLMIPGLVAALVIPLMAVESNGQWFNFRRGQSAQQQKSSGRFSFFRWKSKTKTKSKTNDESKRVPQSPVTVPQGNKKSSPMVSGISQSQKVVGSKKVDQQQKWQARTPQANQSVELAAKPRTILPPNYVGRTSSPQRRSSSSFHTTQLPFRPRSGSPRRPSTSSRGEHGSIQQVAFQTNATGVPVPEVDFTRPNAERRAPQQSAQAQTPGIRQYPPARLPNQNTYPPQPSVVGAPAALPVEILSPLANGQRTVEIPFIPPGPKQNDGTVSMSTNNGRMTLVSRDTPLSKLLGMIAEQNGLNIIVTDDPTVTVSVTLTNVPLEDALNSILSVTGYTWSRQRDIITVSSLATASLSPTAQGRIVKLFPLNFTASVDVEQVVTGLLSPVGHVFTTQTSATDTRRTRETVVIEDIPEYVDRIASYIREIDQPPRQVMIEAHILQVDLSDTIEHGVNFQDLAKLAGTRVNISSSGFANAGANPALLIGIDGGEVDGLRLIEALKTTADTKTLASPKVLALNGQESRIQIGGQLGFLQTTTTETATLQNVTFLEVGVVLTVTPYISDDGRILMRVKPEVSSGRINPDTGLPEEETTEVETTVMLNDGQGMIIGGLIQEADEDDQSKVPILGDAPVVGRLFQRRRANRQRSEVIIALIPRVIPYDEQYQGKQDVEFERATTPLLQGPLHRHPRPWEPRLPDACPQEEGVITEECQHHQQTVDVHDYDVSQGTTLPPVHRTATVVPKQHTNETSAKTAPSNAATNGTTSARTHPPKIAATVTQTPVRRPYPVPEVDTATQQIAAGEPFFGSSGPVATMPPVTAESKSTGVVPAAFRTSVSNSSKSKPR